MALPSAHFFFWSGPGPGRFFLMKSVAACGGNLRMPHGLWFILDGV